MHIAGWGWRLLAYLIDGFILGIPLSLVQSRLTMPAMDAYSNWLMDLTRGQQGPFPQEMINAWLLSSLISLVVWILYRTAMVAWKGGSLGQLILGMRVVRDGDQSLAVPTLGTAASRAVVAMILFTLPLVGLVNGLWPLFNDKRQALHDLVAKTVVLKKY